MKKTMIVTGGRVSAEFTKETLRSYQPDVLIASDRGIMVFHELDLIPDYLVGDFDSGDGTVISYYRTLFEKEGKPIIRSFLPEKDETDSELAISLALSIGSSEILILGATGTRLDHTMANVGLLLNMLEAGVKGYLADEYNLISLHDEGFVIRKDYLPYPYFSLLPFSGTVKGLTIKGAKYEVSSFDLLPGSSIGISNELVGKDVKISFREGRLLLFLSSDCPVGKPFQ